MARQRPRAHSDDRSHNLGRPTDLEETSTREQDPPAEAGLPKSIVVRPAGSVTLPDWDQEAHAIKDDVVRLFAQLSNRRRDNGTPSNEYVFLECVEVQKDGTVSAFARRQGVARITLGDALDVLRLNQGTTARELTQKIFPTTKTPAVFEPRVRSMLSRLKLKGWADMRYDDRNIQRWYATDIDTPPAEWDSRARAIAYTLVDLWGGKPRDYVRQVDALCALLDAQGERVAEPSAWLVKRESPF